MKRLAIVIVLVVAGLSGFGSQRSQANIISFTPVAGVCTTAVPQYAIVPCNPLGTPTTRALIPPVKTLDVGAGVPGPLNTIAYPVTITSHVVCFSLDEPITAYVMGAPQGSSVLTQQRPVPAVPGNGQTVNVTVDPTTFTALLTLEISRTHVGPSGIAVKASWPLEGLDLVRTVIEPVPPTATPSPTPHVRVPPGTPPPSPPAAPTGPTSTPAPTSTVAPTLTSTATVTSTSAPASPTATGSVTPVPTPIGVPDTRAMFARVCVTPTPVPTVNGQTTIYVQTKPGAVCTATVVYDNNRVPQATDFNGGPQVALADGLAVFPLTVNNARARGATVTATCTLGTDTVTAKTFFTIFPPTTPTAVTP